MHYYWHHLCKLYYLTGIADGGYCFFLSPIEEDASGANFRNWEGVSIEASINTWYSITKTCSSRFLQGKELQAHWFLHSQRFVFFNGSRGFIFF